MYLCIFIALMFSFLGISIVADIFMCSIEKITSKTKRIHIAVGGSEEEDIIEVPVWNGTVANLTLMALGKTFYALYTKLVLAFFYGSHCQH